MTLSVSNLVDREGRPAWVAPFAPLRPPAPWRLWEIRGDGASYLEPGGLAVIVSGGVQADGKRWVHVSLSRKERIPSWNDLTRVKDAFIGRDNYAVQVLPPEDRYVRIHPNVLHLFHCVDGHPLPEFSGFLPDGRRSL